MDGRAGTAPARAPSDASLHGSAVGRVVLAGRLETSPAAYCNSCVMIAGFGLPQPVTRSNAVPAE